MLELLDGLRRSRGLTVLLVTHDADVAARADRVVTMLDGRADCVRPKRGESAADLRERADEMASSRA